MFNWFKGYTPAFTATEYVKPSAPNLTPFVSNTENGYTVGVTADGSTLLKTTCDGQTMTLKMSDYGTRRLISLLEATLTEEE